MTRLAGLASRTYARLDGLEWLVRLVIRVAVGLEFFGSGLGQLVTAAVPEKHLSASWHGLLDFLYLPEVLLLLLLAWLVFAGPGRASLDARLRVRR